MRTGKNIRKRVVYWEYENLFSVLNEAKINNRIIAKYSENIFWDILINLYDDGLSHYDFIRYLK